MAESAVKHHDYYLPDPSPWPIAGSISALVMLFGAVVWMKSADGVFGLHGPWICIVGALALLGTMFAWFREIIVEAVYKHTHTPALRLAMRYGMILFIASEVMFFVAWFWAYFDVSLFPADVSRLPDGQEIGVVGRDQVLGGKWPPVPDAPLFRHTFDPWGLPLFNTLVLLTSAVTVTWAHNSLLKGDRKNLIRGLALTIILGITFHALPSLRIFPRRLHLRGPRLRLDLLHGDRFPRLPCDRGDHLPDGDPPPGHRRPFHAEAAFRLGSRRLVLAFRRRGLALPVRQHLCVGRRLLRGGVTPNPFGGSPIACAPPEWTPESASRT